MFSCFGLPSSTRSRGLNVRPRAFAREKPGPQQQLPWPEWQPATALTASPADCSKGRSEGGMCQGVGFSGIHLATQQKLNERPCISELC